MSSKPWVKLGAQLGVGVGDAGVTVGDGVGVNGLTVGLGDGVPTIDGLMAMSEIWLGCGLVRSPILPTNVAAPVAGVIVQSWPWNAVELNAAW
jgi:hypothetical protein